MFVCDVIDVIYILGVFMTNLHVQSWASGGEGGGGSCPLPGCTTPEYFSLNYIMTVLIFIFATL